MCSEITLVTLNHLKYVTKEITAQSHRYFKQYKVLATSDSCVPLFSVPLSTTVFIVCGHMPGKLGRYKGTKITINERKMSTTEKQQ